tara:strand:- start:689 stop:1369 length:681 start_codon:yes stop_codon:yes gene_type:complete
MRNYKVKWQQFLFFRWFVVSWVLHGVHVLDRSERILRILMELVSLGILYSLFFIFGIKNIWVFTFGFISIHTFYWLAASHWLVGYREVNKKFQGKGINSVIEFLEFTKKNLDKYPSVSAIAVYGSLSREKFHKRSDLDLRVVQEKPINLKLFWTINQLRFIGIWKYKIPLDLKLVDSVDYLKNEMRLDEKPIMVYKKYDNFFNEGDDFSMLKASPQRYLKIQNESF